MMGCMIGSKGQLTETNRMRRRYPRTYEFLVLDTSVERLDGVGVTTYSPQYLIIRYACTMVAVKPVDPIYRGIGLTE